MVRFYRYRYRIDINCMINKRIDSRYRYYSIQDLTVVEFLDDDESFSRISLCLCFGPLCEAHKAGPKPSAKRIHEQFHVAQQ